MNKKYWLIISNEDNWEIINNNLVYAFSKESEFKKVNEGDYLVIYITSCKIRGLFKIISTESQNLKLFEEKYIFYISIEPIKIFKEDIIVNDKWNKVDHLNNISIFKNKSRWGTTLMGRSIIELTNEDFQYIKKVNKNGY